MSAPLPPVGWAPLDVPLKRLSETPHKLAQLNERWNDRLILEWLSLREAYLEGRLCISLVMQVNGAPGCDRTSNRKNQERCLSDVGGNIVFIINAPNAESSLNCGNNQRPVFINSIKLIQPDVFGTVRAYAVCDQGGEIGSRPLYYSIFRLRYDRLLVPIYRETSGFRIDPKWFQDVERNVIEGRPQVVHDVANDGGYFSGGQHWDWLKEIGALRISVYSNTVSVTHEEGVNPALHVADVMIGPFDL